MYKKTSSKILEKASGNISGQKCSAIEVGSDVCAPSMSKVCETDKKENNITELEDLKFRDKQSLSIVQMIKNVIRTRMEMRNKKSNNCVRKAASKILKANKKFTKKNGKVEPSRQFVIDLNVNVNCSK